MDGIKRYVISTTELTQDQAMELAAKVVFTDMESGMVAGSYTQQSLESNRIFKDIQKGTNYYDWMVAGCPFEFILVENIDAIYDIKTPVFDFFRVQGIPCFVSELTDKTLELL